MSDFPIMNNITDFTVALKIEKDTNLLCVNYKMYSKNMLRIQNNPTVSPDFQRIDFASSF